MRQAPRTGSFRSRCSVQSWPSRQGGSNRDETTRAPLREGAARRTQLPVSAECGIIRRFGAAADTRLVGRTMTPHISLEQIWYDNDVLELRVEVCDGRSLFSCDAYVSQSWPRETVDALMVFREQVHSLTDSSRRFAHSGMGHGTTSTSRAPQRRL